MERTRQSGILRRMCLACGLLLAVAPVWAARPPCGTGSSGSNSGAGSGGTQPDPGETQEGQAHLGPAVPPPPEPIIYGQNLDGPLSERLQALAFGIGAFDTATGLVTVQRTADSWFQIDRNTGAFTLVSPGCPDGTGTITTSWSGDELTVTLVGTMCDLEGSLAPIDAELKLTVGAHPGEVRFWLDGDDQMIYRNLGRVLVETDAWGSWVRPVNEPIQWLGQWDDLLGMAAVTVATLDGETICHPAYEPEDPPPDPPADPRTDCDDHCLDECRDAWDPLIEQAEFELGQAQQNLVTERAAAIAAYRAAVEASAAMREACVDGIARNYAILAGAEIIVGTGIIIGEGVSGVGAVGIVGTIAGMDGALIAEGLVAWNSMDGCDEAHQWRVELARQTRDSRIESAENAVEAAEERLQWLLDRQAECVDQCCPLPEE